MIVFLEALLMTKQKGMGQDGTWLVSTLFTTPLTLLPLQEGSLPPQSQTQYSYTGVIGLGTSLEDLSGLSCDIQLFQDKTGKPEELPGACAESQYRVAATIVNLALLPECCHQGSVVLCLP